MLASYLKSALRNIIRRKVYSLINIVGLALGLASTFLIVLYLQHEFSFDKFHSNSENIYRLVCQQKNNVFQNNDTYAITPYLAGPAAAAEIPEVVNSVRLKGFTLPFKTEHNSGSMIGYYADSNFLQVFSFRLLAGDSATALNKPFSLVLPESNARALFGNSDPLGQTIEAFEQTYTITGVLEDIPQNSNLQFDYLCSFSTFESTSDLEMFTSWTSSSFTTYCELQEQADPAVVEQELAAMYIRHTDSATAQSHILHLQPLGSIHLHSDVNFDRSYHKSDIKVIYLFISIGVLIFIIACFNYLNLSSAYSSLRFKEIGVRKIVGANKSSLLKLILSESVVISLLAMILACILTEAALPFFNQFVDRAIDLQYTPLNIAIIMGITIVTGLLAGIYPAVIMSTFKPLSIINRKATLRQSSFRNVIVIVQMSVSIFLILAAIVVRQQLNFVNNKDAGFKRDNIMIVWASDENVRNNFEQIKHELEANPDILSISSSNCLPSRITSHNSNSMYDEEGQLIEISAFYGQVDYDFIDLYGIELVRGRQFSRDISSDIKGAAIVNETFVRAHNMDDPLGKLIRTDMKIIGVVRDFNFASFHHKIEPLMLTLTPSANYVMSIKMNGNNQASIISFIENVYNKYKLNQDFSYYLYDDFYSKTYLADYRLGKIFGFFALLAIVLSCLGLYGLVTFQIHKRIKELGIRKVLGASFHNIIMTLSKDFVKGMLFANLIAWPVGFYFMNNWLKDFAYRINMSPLFFILSGAAVFGIAILTIGMQTIRAARANPVDVLKQE